MVALISVNTEQLQTAMPYFMLSMKKKINKKKSGQPDICSMFLELVTFFLNVICSFSESTSKNDVMSTFYSKASSQTSEVFSLPACFIAFIPLCLTETYQIDIQCGVPRRLINLPKCMFFYSVHGAQSLLYESHMRNTQTQLFFLM